MQLTLTDSAQHGQTLGIQSTGGVIDIYVFSGPTPESVILEYLSVIGKPAFVPYWSLGFHNCRWGYKNLTIVEEVVANYSKAGIPLETEWVDIDYMDAYLDFTTDPINFPQDRLKSFVDQLHANNQHFVPIVDPGIYTGDAGYPAYTEGMDQNVFISAIDGQPYLGQVLPFSSLPLSLLLCRSGLVPLISQIGSRVMPKLGGQINSAASKTWLPMMECGLI
jgi:alpha-glucosidase (family GH31 glycosyl hydrolase)